MTMNEREIIRCLKTLSKDSWALSEAMEEKESGKGYSRPEKESKSVRRQCGRIYDALIKIHSCDIIKDIVVQYEDLSQDKFIDDKRANLWIIK
jgi:hypothetical protein